MIRLLTKQETIDHLLELSPEDRYSRFCTSASDDYIKKYVDSGVGFFYGDVVWQDGCRRVAGVVHICHNKKNASVEVAVSVLPEFKGQNIGTKLMYFTQGIAEVYQADQLLVTGLGSNSPMIQLAKSCGYSVKTEYGEFEGAASTIGADLKAIASKQIKLFKIILGVDHAT